jgi:16S rRNA processing protein RimM
MTDTDIPVGYVRRAHGIRGDVVVRGLVSDAADRLVAGATLTDGSTVRVVTTHRPHKGDVVLHLEGIEDRDAAEALVGTQFVMGIAERRRLGPDEWWAEDIIGCDVLDGDGNRLGVVTDVVVGAAQDRLAVETTDGRSGEIPFVDALVTRVDQDRRTITVDLPAGLFE